MRTIDPENPLASNSDLVDDAPPQPTKMIELGSKESIHDVVDAIDGWRKFLDPFNDHMRYWFRGQPKANWSLKPKLYRMFSSSGDETILMSERLMVRDFRLMSTSKAPPGIRHHDGRFPSAESPGLMSIKDLGEFKLYAIDRFKGILHLAVKNGSGNKLTRNGRRAARVTGTGG